MIKFFNYLYWSDEIKERDRNRIKWYLKIHKRNCLVYVITLCTGTDQLEIYHSAVLQQKYYRDHPPFVIGIAYSYQGAVKIVHKIALESYKKYKHCDLKYYLASL